MLASPHNKQDFGDHTKQGFVDHDFKSSPKNKQDSSLDVRKKQMKTSRKVLLDLFS